MESSSDFIVPADFSSEWREIMLVQTRSRTHIYTATRYGRRFLLKGLAPEAASLTDYRLQQEQEFQLGIQLVHPNIAATYSLEEIDGVGRCIVQEWIDGITLREWRQTNPSKAVKERVLNQLLDALDYIHGLQLVHHDLKADNILITRNGTNVKLIDFGLSATDATLSPVSNDPRTDIEALQRLFPDICPRGQFSNIGALCKVINRRKRLLRLLPVILSAILLAAAVSLFYLSWHERHLEQQRFEAMTNQVDYYIAQERTQLQEILDRREAYDANNTKDFDAYQADLSDLSNVAQYYAFTLLDSIANQYDATDPLREQLWQTWMHRHLELYNELLQVQTSKLQY